MGELNKRWKVYQDPTYTREEGYIAYFYKPGDVVMQLSTNRPVKLLREPKRDEDGFRDKWRVEDVLTGVELLLHVGDLGHDPLNAMEVLAWVRANG